MSIILEGIDMPSRIDLDFHDNHIVLGGVLYPIDIDQLVYIPTPHGRLIDADALELEKEVELADDWKTAHEIANCVKYAPTILEEE